jgi:small subunit ribosomal protein S11
MAEANGHLLPTTVEVDRTPPNMKHPTQERRGEVHAHLSYNNTLLTLTSLAGRTLETASAGQVLTKGKGSRRSTAYAGQQVGQRIAALAQKRGYHQVDLFLRGLGKGRFQVAKGLRQGGLRIRTIQDQTPFPHNGCRPPKKRRL